MKRIAERCAGADRLRRAGSSGLGFAKYPPDIATMTESSSWTSWSPTQQVTAGAPWAKSAPHCRCSPTNARCCARSAWRTSRRAAHLYPRAARKLSELRPRTARRLRVRGVKPAHVCIGHLATIQVEPRSRDGDTPEDRQARRLRRLRAGRPPDDALQVPEAEKVKRFMTLVEAGIEDQLL